MLGKLDVKMGEKNRDIDEIDDKLRKIISDIVDDENKVIIDTQVNFSFFEELKFDMTIYTPYIHYKKYTPIKNVTSSLLGFLNGIHRGNGVYAVYALASGLGTETVSTYSGVEWSPVFSFK